ncbi:MAG: hypothetical protein Q8P29_01975 [Candidatus Levybacteria bacterium]|nr:hypothetical protein [Candidatus Levybacteria bacterium]MDZ4228085.1 hypothetical protein [Candidatus Levybacteria bacterium]
MVRELDQRPPQSETEKLSSSVKPKTPTSLATKKPSALEILGDFITGMMLDDLDSTTHEIFIGNTEPEKLSTRQKLGNKIKEKRLSLGEKITKPFIALKATIFVGAIERNIVNPIKPEFPEGFDNTFTEIMKDPSVLPILISNHTGHADAAGTAVISRQLTKLVNKTRSSENQFRGFMLTIAASLESAHQSIFLQQCTNRAKKILPNYGLSLGAYTRPKDVEKYQMDTKNNRVYAEKTSEIIKGGSEREADGLAYYIEGTVEGGRKIKEGENIGQTKGTQRIDCEQLNKIINKAQSRCHRRVVIITASSDGASEVLDPDKDNQPTRKAIKIVINPIPPKKSLLTVRIDMPIFYDDLIRQLEERTGQKATTQDIGDEYGRRISKGLSPNKQGYYKASNE